MQSAFLLELRDFRRKAGSWYTSSEHCKEQSSWQKRQQDSWTTPNLQHWICCRKHQHVKKSRKWFKFPWPDVILSSQLNDDLGMISQEILNYYAWRWSQNKSLLKQKMPLFRYRKRQQILVWTPLRNESPVRSIQTALNSDIAKDAVCAWTTNQGKPSWYPSS